MALRLLNVARTLPSLLVPKLKPVQPPSRTIFKRERLVPFVDDDPCVFSTKAIMHHWGAVPIIVISAVSTGAAILTWLRLALTRIDVYYTASTAHCDNLETRQGPWYKPRLMKFYRINQQCETPRGLICAQQGDASDSSFSEDKNNSKDNQKNKDGNEGEGFNGKSLAAHIAVSAGVIGLAAAL